MFMLLKYADIITSSVVLSNLESDGDHFSWGIST